jgi:hypothetical protein
MGGELPLCGGLVCTMAEILEGNGQIWESGMKIGGRNKIWEKRPVHHVNFFPMVHIKEITGLGIQNRLRCVK